MARTRSLVMALALALLVPAAVSAQQGGGMGRGGMGGQGMGGMMAARNLVEQGSVEFLLSRTSDLRLTEEQSAALKTIAAKWADDTKEQRDQIRPMLPQQGQGMGGMGGGDMQAMRARMEQMMPLAQKLVETDEAAVTEALRHLDETQQATSRRLIQERNQPRRPGLL